MPKIRCLQLAKEMGIEVEELLARAQSVIRPGMSTGKGKNTWFTDEGADLIRQAEESPLTVSRIYHARGLHPAANPRWMMCVVEGVMGKVPVAIPRKLQGKLVNKPFMVEAIKDARGTTYRHAILER